MTDAFNREPMLDMFIFETSQLIEQLENAVLESEKTGKFQMPAINEIFRIMHTIKGSSAMMLFNQISTLAHSLEDLFYFLREEKPEYADHSKLTDIVLEGIDFIKNEVSKIQNGKESDTEASTLIEIIKSFLSDLKGTTPSSKSADQNPPPTNKQKFYICQDKPTDQSLKHTYKAVILFEEGCEMENIRAFSVMHKLKEYAEDISTIPEQLIEDENSLDIIRRDGVKIFFTSRRTLDEIRSSLMETIFLKTLEINEIQEAFLTEEREKNTAAREHETPPSTFSSDKDTTSQASKQSIISVSITKLDKLLDLVGELVISEAMVTQNPELSGLPLSSFYKAARQLRKITGELQDMVMSIRMVPLSVTFQKMNRIVRDMSKKLKKEVDLEIIGEETEVDKNIIEKISDPLMHLIRNAIDHGIEPSGERLEKGKPVKGKITLEARNAGGDVWIIIKDDGRGLNRDKILKKAIAHGLVSKPENELTPKEIYSFIFLPGFSTKEDVTEFSGRGVGMDVVTKNIEKIGGSVLIDSIPGQGTVVSIKIPLTLAIVDGMIVRVGNSRYTIPTASIKESFKVREQEVIKDPDGNEMILIRGESIPIIRIHKIFNVQTQVEKIHDGIIIVVENDAKRLCIFVDELLGEQQVVVKALPKYIKSIKGLAGCTLLGDGNISLIIDISSLISDRS
ncbi:MAG: chemotaxis protein CheA [Clostridia bacterium]|nr:chemotaxis protein CheA [Clostridia bacterium]